MTPAPANTPAHPRAASSEQPDTVLQAVSLHDYEQVVTARASFVDFLLAGTEDRQ
ncbi:hypothetical protein OL239_15935 [Arthrobacter sp. ATA002]|uniref:hypothetical protein n=1 Tax=Arthrobacter sp. ATA002 TaxID=2991715 RepID=UPI0022A72FBE|nr:hypothetical protein [Arthrobacter sp. ATA002]WAP51301.1 hypothetical protein OL239_15935 [Arthrobacter sp. ATA002]